MVRRDRGRTAEEWKTDGGLEKSEALLSFSIEMKGRQAKKGRAAPAAAGRKREEGGLFEKKKTGCADTVVASLVLND